MICDLCICRLPCCTFIISSFLFLLRKRVIEGSREVILFIGRYKMCFSSGAFRLTWKTEVWCLRKNGEKFNKIKSNGNWKPQYWTNVLFHLIFRYIFFLSISSSCRERNQFILTVSTLLMVLEMSTGHFKHVAMDLLFIKCFCKITCPLFRIKPLVDKGGLFVNLL